MKIISLLIYLGGGQVQPPPGHTETKKLRGLIKELGGGSTPLTSPTIHTLILSLGCSMIRQFYSCMICNVNCFFTHVSKFYVYMHLIFTRVSAFECIII